MRAHTINSKTLGIIALICSLAACGMEAEIGSADEVASDEASRTTFSNRMDIEVRLRGTSTLVNPAACNQSHIEARVVDPGTRSCSRPRIYLVYNNTAHPSRSISFNSWTLFDIRALRGRFELRADCGGVHKIKTVYNDFTRPTFTSVSVNGTSSYWKSARVRVSPAGLGDDSAWRSSQYRHVVRLVPAAGGPVMNHSGPTTTAVFSTIAEGRYTGTLRIADGCGRVSNTKSTTFAVDSRRPTVSFSRPYNNAMVRRNAKLKVEVIAGDLVSPTAGMAGTSGLSTVKIYLDAVTGEFSSGKLLCTLKGPWINGFANKASCLVGTTWTRGSHKLIAVARDRAGNTRLTERTIRVY